MKAFWLFAANAGDGGGNNPNQPAMPDGVGGRYTVPGDIIRLTGPAGPNAHRHLLVGGVALPDDNLIGLTGEGHRHYIVKIGADWAQVTVGAPSHTHDLNLAASGGLNPDYFLLFWAGPDADAATIVADPNCWPVCEATVTGGSIGDLISAPWTAEQLATWQARILNVLGVALPAEVDRGKRLVLLFLGALLSRQSGDERGYRFVS